MGFAEYSASKSHRKLPRQAEPSRAEPASPSPSPPPSPYPCSLSLALSFPPPSLQHCARARAIRSNQAQSPNLLEHCPRVPIRLEADGTRLRAYRRWNTWSKIHRVALRGANQSGLRERVVGDREYGSAGGSSPRRKASNRYSIPPRRWCAFPMLGMRRKKERDKDRE